MLKIAVIIGSTRPGRVGESVAKWVYELAKKRTEAEFERTFRTSAFQIRRITRSQQVNLRKSWQGCRGGAEACAAGVRVL